MDLYLSSTAGKHTKDNKMNLERGRQWSENEHDHIISKATNKLLEVESNCREKEVSDGKREKKRAESDD